MMMNEPVTVSLGAQTSENLDELPTIHLKIQDSAVSVAYSDGSDIN